MMVLATVVAAVLGVAAGCGDDDDMAAETTTTEATTTAPVEDSLQQAAEDAFNSCRDAVAAAGSVGPFGEEACEDVRRSLERDIAGLPASAREDVDAALKQLSAKCRNLVAVLPGATQEFGLAACDQLAAEG